MFIRVSNKKITAKEIVQYLVAKGVKVIHDKTRDLYIAVDMNGLYDSTDPFDATVSVKTLRNWFSGNPDIKQEGSNCMNWVALERIDKLKQVIDSIVQSSNPEKLFDYLPYTKTGKFSKNSAINVFIPNIKDTWSGYYFTQNEVALQLRPLEIAYDDDFQGEKSNEIVCLEINPRASFTNKKPTSIVDENGNFGTVENKRNKYLKSESLVAGTSYIDAKGSEYLFLGEFEYDYKSKYVDGHVFEHKGIHYPSVFLRLTSGVKKQLDSSSSLQEFLTAHFTKSCKKYGEVIHGLNITTSKKFVSVGTKYCDDVSIVNVKLHFSRGECHSQCNGLGDYELWVNIRLK